MFNLSISRFNPQWPTDVIASLLILKPDSLTYVTPQMKDYLIIESRAVDHPVTCTAGLDQNIAKLSKYG